MNEQSLIKLIEEYCKENNLDISKIYSKLSELYQDTYGNNIVIEMQKIGEWDITKYLEELGIIDRYISLLNKLKRGEGHV